MTSPCIDRDIVITPTKGRVRISFASQLICETDRALDLAEPGHPVRIYVPRADVNAEVLGPSDHHTMCPFKGDAAYHDLKVDGEVAENAVWYYPDPCPLVEQVRDHLAFWGDQVTVETFPA